MEAFVTPGGVTVETFRDYDPDAGRVSEVRARVLLRMASNAVASLAPPPAAEDPVYTQTRGDCELTLASYGLSSRWGAVSSRDAGDLSISFERDHGVRSIIEQAMGGYVKAQEPHSIRSRPTARG